jgi:hypothetical protein
MEKCSVSAFIPYKLLATKFILQIFYILYIHNASISGSLSYPLNSQGAVLSACYTVQRPLCYSQQQQSADPVQEGAERTKGNGVV